MSKTEIEMKGRYCGSGVDPQSGASLSGETALLRVVEGSSTVLAQFDRMSNSTDRPRRLAHGWHPYPRSDWTDMRRTGSAFDE